MEGREDWRARGQGARGGGLEGINHASAPAPAHLPPAAAEAVRVLETVEALTARVSAAVADCDPLAMTSALTACEAVGVEVEPMATARDVLALDRAAFLRRELSSVLHSHQLAAAAAASAAAAGGVAEPAAAPSRAPSQTELRIVHCTLQVRRGDE